VSMSTSGWAARIHHNGRAIVLAAAAWGVAIALFGLAETLWLALLLLALAGAADGVSGIFRGALWNETIPDEMRGRLAGVEMISWSSGPLLGNARAGVGASLFGLRASVFGGGVLVVAGSVALALALPRFWDYDSRSSAAS
jgi:MFS family permease